VPNVDVGIIDFRHFFIGKKSVIKQPDKLTDQLTFTENTVLSVTVNKIPRKRRGGMFLRCFIAAKNTHHDELPLTDGKSACIQYNNSLINNSHEIGKACNHYRYNNKYSNSKKSTNDLIRPSSARKTSHDGKIRTLTECVIDIAVAVTQHPLHASIKDELLLQLKAIFLSGNISIGRMMGFRNRICSLLNARHELYLRIDELIKSIEKEIYITKHIDNYYGRLFESFLSKYVVLHLSSEMLRVITLIRFELIQDFCSKRYTTKMQNQICRKVAQKLSIDRAAWREEIPEVAKFLKHKKPADFLKMLYCQHRYSALLILHLAVKYIIHAPGFGPLKQIATRFYMDAILPQRDLIYRESSLILSQRKGILLHYQHAPHLSRFDSKGIRPIDKYFIPVHEIGKIDLNALINERPMGIGLSGSANILNYLFLDLLSKHADFPLESARLLAASHLLFSGGHSLNESYTVFHYPDTSEFRLISYATLYNACDLGKEAIDDAYTLLIHQACELNGG
jgi:hypothetical protein